MTEFLKNPPRKLKSAAKLTGSGLTVSAIVFLYTTFSPKSEVDAVERRSVASRNEIRAAQSETWQKLMDVQLEVRKLQASVDMLARLYGQIETNTPMAAGD